MSILKRQVNSSSNFTSFFFAMACNTSAHFKLIYFQVWIKRSRQIPNFEILQVLWWKFAKFLISFSKLQVNFSSSVSWDINPVCFFSWRFIYFQQKEPISTKLSTKGDCQKKLATKIQRSYLSWHWTVMQSLSKPRRVNVHWSTQKSEKSYFHRFFESKAHNVWARKFHRNYVSWHWRVMQNVKEKWLVAWKMRRNLVNFSASSRKTRFVESIKNFRWKSTEELWHWRVMQSLKKN